MGAPKQRWTSEEEAALKAGVAKHGPGNWRTILRNPEFSALLRLRSNIDLKDKWRNLSVTAGGYGSREKARMALKKGRRVPKVIAEPMDVDTNNLDDAHNTVIDAKPLAMAVEPMQLESTPENSVARVPHQCELLGVEVPAMDGDYAPYGKSARYVANLVPVHQITVQILQFFTELHMKILVRHTLW